MTSWKTRKVLEASGGREESQYPEATTMSEDFFILVVYYFVCPFRSIYISQDFQ